MLYLFDIDGTLLLTGGAGTRAINRLFGDRYGVDGAMDGIDPGGKTDPGIFTEIFVDRVGREPEAGELDALLDAYVPMLEAELVDAPRFRIMPWAVECVRWLEGEGRVTLGIATGNVRAAARAKLKRIDLHETFAFGGFGCDSGDRAVLVARAIERAAEHAGRSFPGDEVIVVGDTVRDIDAARACGVRVLAVATGSTSRDDLAAAAPDAVFDTLEDLPSWHQSCR